MPDLKMICLPKPGSLRCGLNNMTQHDYPPEFLEFLRQVKGKRPRTVIDHILKHGFITTEDLKERYGYNHPPRAARDVREHGIPLVTFRVVGSDGRKIAAYKFGDPDQIQKDKLGGRTTIPKPFKDDLIDSHGSRCAICLEEYEANLLQLDHRVPYEVGGAKTDAERVIEDYMLLCGSCNRAKSWSCEQCENWHTLQSVETCRSCYWANPEIYSHIAMKSVRRIDIVWTGEEVPEFDRLKRRVEQHEETIQDYIKAVLARHLQKRTHGEDEQT
jgi:hypothetical protein